MLVTSGAEVRTPGFADRDFMGSDQPQGSVDGRSGRTVVLGEFDVRINPDPRLALVALHVNVRASLLARKEEETEVAKSKARRTHPRKE
jgi:hypothetical protein